MHWLAHIAVSIGIFFSSLFGIAHAPADTTSAPTEQEQQGWHSYQNPDLGFEFLYPPDWSVDTAYSTGEHVLAVSDQDGDALTLELGSLPLDLSYGDNDPVTLQIEDFTKVDDPNFTLAQIGGYNVLTTHGTSGEEQPTMLVQLSQTQYIGFYGTEANRYTFDDFLKIFDTLRKL